ncbi:MAG: arylsulfatase [Phycisphaeraceae bacterium]
MAPQFQGKIGLDVRNSTPDWSAYAPVRAPEGAPNVLYIVWDDVGFGAFSCYGGLIEAPNMKRIADMGLRYTQFHTTALCSPSRACFLTGRNATSNGMACITEGATGFPGNNGRVPDENAMISQGLVEKGYNTYAVGKWHLTPADECHAAATKRRWPLGRGFERFYGFHGGETDQWFPDLVYDNHPVAPPYKPSEGYHLSHDLTDQAMRFIRDAKSIDPGKPWLMYYCPGAAHAPHQVFRDWADKYKGTFDMGYEKYREVVLENQKKMGLVPENTELPPLNPYADATSADGKPWPALDTVPPWDTLSEDEKRLHERMAEVYAGFVDYTDAQIGRLLDYLEESGQFENTIIVVVSDNGASGEGGPTGSVNENKFFNGIPDSLEENLKLIDELGSEKTYNHYSTGWATAFCTPFKMYKRYAGYEGGTADPLIVAWPKGIAGRGEVRHQYLHAIDIVPTLYDCLGIEPPATVNGYTQSPIEGASFRASFDDAEAPAPRDTQFYSMLGSRGIWHSGWHAATVHPAIAGWSNFAKDRWELYHLESDRNQLHDLADQHPDVLEQLKNLWFYEAGQYQGLPLDDRTPVEILTAARPEAGKPREHFVYYPNTAAVPESVAADIRGRAYNIVADMVIQTPEAEGVLLSMGSRFGGHALYIKDRRLHYVYNWLGEDIQHLVSDQELPTGEQRLGVRFRPDDKEGPSAVGEAVLYFDGQSVGSARIRTQPGYFGLSGGGLTVGRSEGQPVTGDYETPFAFRGGILKHVLVDVSGERYRDLVKEAEAMLARD